MRDTLHSDTRGDWLSTFTSSLAKPENVPVFSSAGTHRSPNTANRAALCGALESRDCQPGEAALQLGIDRETEARCLQKLLLAGIVTEEKSGLRVVGELTVDTRALPQLKAHWAAVAQERARDPLDADVFSYHVLSVSAEDLSTIRARLRATYREIGAIVSNSAGTDCVALVNLPLVNWDRANPEQGSRSKS